MTTASIPGEGADAAPFLAPTGSNVRQDLADSDVTGGHAVIAADGSIDQAAFATGLAEMLTIVERVERAMEGGAKVKRVNELGEIVEGEATPMRSNDAIYELCKRFLTPPGPTFISDPIDGFVYIAHTPRLMDRMDAEAAASKQGGDEQQAFFFNQLSLVLACLYGRVRAERAEVLAVIKAMQSDTGRWVGLIESKNVAVASLLVDTNPYAMTWTIKPLLDAWWTWYAEVMPSPAELKKYRALAGTATTS